MSQSSINEFITLFYSSITDLIKSVIACESVYLYLPSRYPEVYNSSELELIPQENPPLLVSNEDPIIGFVASHNEIFNINGENQSLPPLPNLSDYKHILAIPIILFNLPNLEEQQQSESESPLIASLSGVLTLTRTPNSQLFSTEDEDLAIHFSHILSTTIGQIVKSIPENRATGNYLEFSRSVEDLEKKLGLGEVAILRLKSPNFNKLEDKFGTQIASNKYEQAKRLVQQILPPQFPINQLPNGDLLIAVDKLMVEHIVSKIAVSFISNDDNDDNLKFAEISTEER